uniref:TauD/TfdA family dioxygenase n=1 Tax=Acinetobacter indicus TaxID=756892 RepID=UPI0014907791
PPASLENPTVEDCVRLVEQNRDLLTDLLKNNKSILLKGFNLSTAEDFSRVIHATGWEEFGYRGAVVRTSPAKRVFTANEAPLDWNIGFHHEMALIKVYPRKLIFFCETPSPEGGQTTAIRSDVVVQKLEELAPDVVEKLETQGIRFFHIRQKDTWQRLVGEKDPVDAAKAAIE